ncbi:aminotransferase class I/II-fold pyridoxal phosphate-dependent enzyme, partial [Bacillus sp. SIMBA_161]
ENAAYFKEKVINLGFQVARTETPIIPMMIGDESLTFRFSKALIERGVFAQGIAFPTVAQGKARIRAIVTAEDAKDELDRALTIIDEEAKKLNILD